MATTFARVPAPRCILAAALRTEGLQAFLILFGVLAAAYHPALCGDRTLMASAAGLPSVMPWGALGEGRPFWTGPRSADPAAPAWQFEASIAFEHDELRAGRYPSWNPYLAYGTPWAAGMLPQPVFPPTLLLALHPSPRTVSWFVVARLLVAGWFAYLFFRMFAPKSASVIGALIFALQGYFILNLNIEHLSTEILLPMVFWAFENLARRGDARSRTWSVVAIVLSIISGMPESTFLVLVFGAVYFLFRVLADRQLRGCAIRRLLEFAAVTLIGLAACGFVLVPFVEFLQNGIDSHRTSITGVIGGLIHGSDAADLFLLYLLPYAFGPFGHDVFAGFKGIVPVWSYVGVGAAVLGVCALWGTLRSPRTFRTREPLTLFFAAAVLLMFLKHFGNPAVNWIGALPLFDAVLYPKYLQPLIGFALAALACLGAAEVVEGSISVRRTILASLAVLGAMLGLASTRWTESQAIEHARIFYYGILAGTLVLSAFAATAAWSARTARRSGRPSPVAESGMIVWIALELTAGFLYPATYLDGKLPPVSFDPYQGAPYVRFLQARSADGYRIFGRDGYLHPDWASAFALSDVRYISGMNYDRFLRFIRALLGSGDVGLHGDLADRFTGMGYPFATTEARRERFITLSSIRYLVQKDYMAAESPLITAVLEQNEHRIRSEGIFAHRTVYRLQGEAREVLFEHPPANRLRVKVEVPTTDPAIAFTPVIDPAIQPGCGDGVGFKIEIEEPRGIRVLYDRYLDPKADPRGQRWKDDLIDLRAHAGQAVSLLFSTSGGPAGNTACDWAAWGGLRFARSPATKAAGDLRYHLVYDGEARIYEYPDSLPRAAVFSSAIVAGTAAGALSAVANPSFDPWRSVVVERAALDPALAASLADVASQPPDRARAANILEYDSQRVTVEAQASRPGVLLLNDSNYPGWEVSVDGKPAALLRANYLFRGVLLPPGLHRVEFRYAPVSLRIGTAISALAIAVLLFWGRRARRTR